jgi:hypothetical protein
LQGPQRSQGQTCRGDIDGDGQVTATDLQMVVTIVAGEVATPTLRARADVNSDGAISAADVVRDVQLQGPGCVPVPPTASPTRTPTPTPTLTPTARLSCVVVPAQFGTTNGTLTPDDCQQRFNGTLRHTDVYSITGTLGQAITVQMTATGSPPIVPYVVVVDSDGQFGQAQGSPPIKFVVSSSQPYQIVVASAPAAAQELGPYQLTVTQMACPTPVVFTSFTTKSGSLAASDCPDPGAPSVGASLNPADIYTFQVLTVPTNIRIVMRQQSVDDDIYPAFSVLTPDGIEGVTQFNNWDCTSDTSDLVCSEAQFMALQPGTYTIIAAGGTGKYSLALTSPSCTTKTLSNIPSVIPTPCTKSGPGCVLGSLSSSTGCAAPLPIPGISDFAPADANSPADRYTFTAVTGDVISVSMISDGDAHLYLLGPAPDNPLIVQDDDSLGSDAQLAATLVQPGTYTIIAANNYGLYSDDEPLAYTLQVQKCPVRAALTPSSTGVTLDGSFSDTDCVGFGGVPYGTYSFTGTAGDVVSVKMISEDVDAFVRMFGPDGSVVEDNDDLLASNDTTDAQVNRILPAGGTYFVEVSTNGGADTAPFFSPPAFTIQARTCPAIPAAPGTINGAFADTDCQATDGTPFNVFAFTPAAAPGAASVLPPSNGCLVALLAQGAQTPNSGCSTGAVDFPMVSSTGSYGFIVAANDPDVRGPYTAHLAECPLSLLTFGDVRSGSLASSDCQAAGGAPADWFLVLAPANVVWFNEGVFGTVTASFAPVNVLTDMTGSFAFSGGLLGDDPSSMYSFGSDLAILLRIAGQTPADQGAYTVSIDPAQLRQ